MRTKEEILERLELAESLQRKGHIGYKAASDLRIVIHTLKWVLHENYGGKADRSDRADQEGK